MIRSNGPAAAGQACLGFCCPIPHGFDTPIRSLWPTEIFAWLRLRQERGLPLPKVEHPLLEQPLGHFDPEIVRNWQPERWFAEFVDKLVQFNPRYKNLPELVFGAG